MFAMLGTLVRVLRRKAEPRLLCGFRTSQPACRRMTRSRAWAAGSAPTCQPLEDCLGEFGNIYIYLYI